MTLTNHWPLFGLRIRTANLELRPPTDDDLTTLVELAAKGVHDPATMPFTTEWTDIESPEFERQALQFHWRARADFAPAKWELALAVLNGGEVIGTQGLSAIDFPTVRIAETGSWLGLAHHGRGLGKEMRRAVVHFAFTCLGAEAVKSSAYLDNEASKAVSLAVGYEPNGRFFTNRRGRRGEQIAFLLTKERWQAVGGAGIEVEVDGFEPCRPLFGI